MLIFLPLLAIATTALGAFIPKEGGAKPDLVKLVAVDKSSALSDYEVLFYEDINFKGRGWGMLSTPNQPSSPDNAGQFCYFVESGRVSSLKLVKQRNDRKFSCRFFRTTEACQHNIPALTLDYPAERSSLGPELDNQIDSVLCWWTSSAQEQPVKKHEVAELKSYSPRQQEIEPQAPHLVDVFANPNFGGDNTGYYYGPMLQNACLNFIEPDNPKWSSLRLNDFNTVYWCRFYEATSCVENDVVLYFDIKNSGGVNSVHDLQLTKDIKGKPWDNRVKSMKCKIGPWTEQPQKRSGETAYALELFKDYNFTGTAQYYTWGQVTDNLCVTFSRTSGISSIRKNSAEIDGKDFVCRGYATPDCLPLPSADPNGKGAYITLDTFDDLRQSGWDDRVWSVKCNVPTDEEDLPTMTGMGTD